jgi:2-oxoglutarate dehydrogenase E1 component|tara:strand:+ start:394 stop:3186 length:2793 start_codon:yes stop_codon:yes gene_type:complete
MHTAMSTGTAPMAVGRPLDAQTIQESMRLMMLIRSYQISGHSIANLDPLALDEREMPISLDPSLYGFTEDDMDRDFFIGTWKMKGFLSEDRPVQTLRQILTRLKETYCGTVGYEYMHIQDREQCNWLRAKIETERKKQYSPERKQIILDRLAWGELFEGFLSNKYSAAKRFGLEGCESLVPGFKEAIDKAAEMGVEAITIGMPHRGRLNVLANVVRKPLQTIFNEFKGGPKLVDELPNTESQYTGSGDVKYHLGTSFDRPTLRGGQIHLSLVANPSHLEAVNTVVTGKTRAKQFYTKDPNCDRSMAILLHGDGAFSGQGIVYETLDMSKLPEYSVGGTLHIVVNNQVAFTTDPKYSRSSAYCTDVAKGMEVPVFHVNGDDVEAVAWVMELATEWRMKWKTDAVVDIVCYRKYGHNEIDEPMFTQPLMYKVIQQHPSALTKYSAKLVNEGIITPEDFVSMKEKINNIMEEEFTASKDYVPKQRDWLASHWQGFKSPDQLSRIADTGLPMDHIKNLGQLITAIPAGFTPHRVVKRVYENRRAMIENGKGIDWAMGEALAFASLLDEGNHVRLSGQDVERGTFSHRHALIHDQITGERFIPLRNVYSGNPGRGQNFFTVCNSSLSEYGVLGFELGYSLEHPNCLILWEAQFGDFSNTAQVIIDQFISSGEAKWLRQSGLTLLLPHGYDGQGPEHSSARLERFLQMADEDPTQIPEMEMERRTQLQECNWQICNVTTPANYFHMLRRQVHREFRKPLVVMSPKNLLRHPKAVSDISEFDNSDDNDSLQGVRFKRLIMDKTSKSRSMDSPAENEVERVIFCSGKVYYDLDDERDAAKNIDRVKICRIEQLAPFPWDLVKRELKRYPNAEVVWCQEEPMNMGAWWHVQPRMSTLFKDLGRSGETRYAGRKPASSPATGYAAVHAQEQAQLVADAIR